MQLGACEVSGDTLILVVIGLAALVFGCAGLRTMALRSVSLRMLRAIGDGLDPRASFEAGIERRIADLDRHGWARLQGDQFEITTRGRRVVENSGCCAG